MKLGELPVPRGAHHRTKRLGCGESSGHGKTSGKGHKGQKSRSGPGLPPGFEGGQVPMIRKIPKRGFRHLQRIPIQTVNVKELNRFPAGSVLDPAAFTQAGLVGTARHLVKILGDGALDRALKVKAHRFSKSALEKIAAAGGSAEVL